MKDYRSYIQFKNYLLAKNVFFTFIQLPENDLQKQLFLVLQCGDRL